MSMNQDSPESQANIPPRFQFGLSTMFWVTTATAIVCSLLFRIPADFSIPIMLFISVAVLPAVWTTVIIYGRGYQRTFGIGAMFPSGFFLLSIAFDRLDLFRREGLPPDEFWGRILMLGLWLSCLLVGVACMGVRRLVEKRQPSRRQ